MKTHVLTAMRMAMVTLLLTGFVYPLLVTGLAELTMPGRAAGSFVTVRGATVGSELIGQAFARPEYVQPRLSAAGAGYDATASGGSNLGPTSRKLRERVIADAARLRAQNPEAPGPVPVELVTTSASGLDPDLSPVAALWQAPRIAAARQIPISDVENVIRRHVKGRMFGFLGQPRINVLAVNLALDRISEPIHSSRMR